MIDYKSHAEFLYGLLDDIDTAGDICKSDDAAYRKMVEKIHRRRFEVADSDGYSVYFKDENGVSGMPQSDSVAYAPVVS